MKDWLIGTAIVLSIPAVTGAVWFLSSLIMGPNVLGAIAALVCGGLWFRWLMEKLNKWG